MDSNAHFILWVVGAVLLFVGLQFVLGARVYLLSAARRWRARAIERGSVPPADLTVIESADEELEALGFEELGFCERTALLTYYSAPDFFKIWRHASLPVIAWTGRRIRPEFGRVTFVRFDTRVAGGRVVATGNVAQSDGLGAPQVEFETSWEPTATLIFERHQRRLATVPVDRIQSTLELAQAIVDVNAECAAVNELLHTNRWVAASSDPELERFTLRGAFALAWGSLKFARQSQVTSEPRRQMSDCGPADRKLRALADYVATERIAIHPERPQDSNRTLVGLAIATALLSFAAAAALWNAMTAAVLLLVLTIHEGGHAFAMRLFGYRDVNVFFVPLLGALTVGAETAVSVRTRLGVLLAGPVPGLWLAVVLLLWFPDAPWLRPVLIGLVFINALNLLPVTPLDGGRIFETLAGPASSWRLSIHVLSALVLLAAGIRWHDPIFIVLGASWALMIPRQLRMHRLRRTVAARVGANQERGAIIAITCEELTDPAYDTWPATVRQTTARSLAQQLSQPKPTRMDRWLGVAGYLSAWVPVMIVAALWVRR